MKLDDSQRQKVAVWIAEGATISQVQSRLASELKVNLTYMEVRFLVDDLKLTPKDPEPPKVVAPPPEAVKPVEKAIPAAPAGTPGAPGVALTVDQVTRPGAIVSGKVVFSDGQQADWYLDQTGRLGVVTKQTGYKPSAADVQQFQAALQSEMARMGF